MNVTKGKWAFSGGLRYENSNTDGTSIFIEDGTIKTEVKKDLSKKSFLVRLLAENYLNL